MGNGRPKGSERQVLGRIRTRVEWIPGEGVWGYLRRIARHFHYSSPLWLLDLAHLSMGDMENEASAEMISYVLRLEVAEWYAIAHCYVKPEKNCSPVWFLGNIVPYREITHRRPRVCCKCLADELVEWAVWELSLYTTCPIHDCLMIDACPRCGREISRLRASVHLCVCGYDLRFASPSKASTEMLTLTAAIDHAAAGFSDSDFLKRLRAQCFPRELKDLGLASLLQLVRFIGDSYCDGTILAHAEHWWDTDLQSATGTVEAATQALANWPTSFVRALSSTASRGRSPRSLPTISSSFGKFYTRLFVTDFSGEDFDFVREAYERFALLEWYGPVDGHESWFTASAQGAFRWYTAAQAKKTEHILHPERLVKTGEVDGFSMRAGGRRVTFISKASLTGWLAARNNELRNYMSRPATRRSLGLSATATLRVAEAGVIRFTKALRHRYYLFLRSDVLNVKRAFERYHVPLSPIPKRGCTTLNEAITNFLGHGKGVASAIAAVVAGELVPVARSARFAGITGYIFKSDDLHRYIPLKRDETKREVFNLSEAARYLNTNTTAILALVKAKVFAPLVKGREMSRRRFVFAAEVRAFGERYVSTRTVTEQTGVQPFAIVAAIQNANLPSLAVSVPEKGCNAWFIPKREISKLFALLRSSSRAA